MKINKVRHNIIEQAYRALRALLIISAAFVWLEPDSAREWVILSLIVSAGILEQLHGLWCRLVEKAFHWKQDFNKWN